MNRDTLEARGHWEQENRHGNKEGLGHEMFSTALSLYILTPGGHFSLKQVNPLVFHA